jgi:heme exporter protein A
MYCLTCDNLTKTFSFNTVFSKLSFTVNTGNILAITGKNGSGKSTLIKIISGLLSQSTGEVKLTAGSTLIPKKEFYRYIGFVSPYLNLYDELTAIENIKFFSRLKKNNFNIDKAEALFRRLDIYNSKDLPAGNYSSGMKQRLKLIFALIDDPPVLIMDEPSSNLDTKGAEIINELISEQKEKNITIIATNNEREVPDGSRILKIEEYK